MGWGGFLSGAAGAASELADQWITQEMEMIRQQRVEEAAIRKENRTWAREDVVYDKKRKDALEDYDRNREDELADYERKKQLDAKYRQGRQPTYGTFYDEQGRAYRARTDQEGPVVGSVEMETTADDQRGKFSANMTEGENPNRYAPTKTVKKEVPLYGQDPRRTSNSTEAAIAKQAASENASIFKEYGYDQEIWPESVQERFSENESFLERVQGSGDLSPERNISKTERRETQTFKTLSQEQIQKLWQEGFRVQRNSKGEYRVSR